MIKLRRKAQLYEHQKHWLSTQWHFSFGSYVDPEWSSWGELQVLNNDRIDPGGRFPEHSHDNMEILTWVIDGTLRHSDSTDGEGEVLGNGIQRMSAGTGVTHAEWNPTEDKQLHLIQVWIEPAERNIAPAYEQMSFTDDYLTGRLRTVASCSAQQGVDLNQDARMSIGHLQSSQSVDIDLSDYPRSYILVMKGHIRIDDLNLNPSDALAIADEDELSLNVSSSGPAKIMLLENNT